MTSVLRPQQARIKGQLVVYRTDSGQEVRNRRVSFPLIFYNSNLQPRDTTTTTDYLGRSGHYYYYYYYDYYYYYYRRYRGHLRLQNQELREVSFQESIILYKEYQLPATLLCYFIVIKSSIIVFEP